jgi:hypothetical protein
MRFNDFYPVAIKLGGWYMIDGSIDRDPAPGKGAINIGSVRRADSAIVRPFDVLEEIIDEVA